jgi:hypothetical protein
MNGYLVVNAKICGWTPSNKHQFSLGSDVDIGKLEDVVQGKKETERRNKIYAEGLRLCPNCYTKTLFYNSRDDQFECLRCKFIITSDAREYRRLVGDWWDKAVFFLNQNESIIFSKCS